MQENRGVHGVVLINNEGIPLKTTMVGRWWWWPWIFIIIIRIGAAINDGCGEDFDIDDDDHDDDDDVFQDNSTTVQYGGLVSHLANKAKSIVSHFIKKFAQQSC